MNNVSFVFTLMDLILLIGFVASVISNFFIIKLKTQANKIEIQNLKEQFNYEKTKQENNHDNLTKEMSSVKGLLMEIKGFLNINKKNNND